MARGSYTAGLAGLVGGILIALLAIVIGFSSVRMCGGDHEANAAHSAAH